MIREDLNKVNHYLSPHPLEEIVVDVYQYIDIIYTVYNVHFSASTRKMLVSLEGTKGRRCCRCSMKPRSESSQSSPPPGPRSGDGRVWRSRGTDAAASHTPAWCPPVHI